MTDNSCCYTYQHSQYTPKYTPQMPINKGLHTYTPKIEILYNNHKKRITQPVCRSAFQETPQTQPVSFRTENTQALHSKSSLQER